MSKISKDEASVLSWWDDMDEFYCASYQGMINHTKLTRAELKPIIASLKEKDYLRYVRGLMNEDGEVGGAGWELTRAGRDAYYERLEELTTAPKDIK